MRSIHIAIPIIVFTIFCTGMIFWKDPVWAIGMAIGIVLLVALLMVKDTIDWKFYFKNPPELELPIKGILAQIPFYKNLKVDDRFVFEQRLSLFMLARDYKMQPTRKNESDDPIDAPEDVKAICSIPAIIMTWGQEDYLFKKIEKIILYNHPFPSPRYPPLHACESDKDDLSLIFSLPHLEKGVKDPYTYFDIGLYEWLRISGKSDSYCKSWEDFSNNYPLTEDDLKSYIGLPKIDLAAACRVMEIHLEQVKNS